MQHVTGLYDTEFSDRCDLGQPQFIPRPKAKTVKFLDLFGDPATISEEDMWEICEPLVSDQSNIKIKNK